MPEKHTPGPFVVVRKTTPGEFVTETQIRSEDDSLLAVVGPCNIENNSRLFAAAPEMLEALERCLPWLEELEFPVGASAAKQARAAIAKATGENLP